MDPVIIYNATGENILEILVDDKSYRFKELMSQNQMVLYFSMAGFQEIPVGSYVDFKAERYFLTDPQNFKKIHSRNFEYSLTLDGWQVFSTTTKYKFFTMADGLVNSPFELKFSLTATPAEFAQLWVDNMNLVSPGWTVGDCIEADPVTLDFNHSFCWDVLGMIADAFSTEWEIETKTLHIRKVEKMKDAPIPLKYGYNCGLLPGVSRQNTNKKAINRLYVECTDRNIDKSVYGSKYLHMPADTTISISGIIYKTDATGTYLEREDMGNALVVEDSIDLTHIYPSRVGTVSSVAVINSDAALYDIIDSSIPETLDFSQQIIAGETMTVIFQTGLLAGKEFDVAYVHAERKFQLVPITDNGFTYPKDAVIPEIGDKYAVFHVRLPNDYITDAEEKVLQAAAEALYDGEMPKYNYTGTLDELYAKRNWLTIGGKLANGYFVSLSDDQFLSDPVLIRIVAVKDFINKPKQPEITLSNEVTGKSAAAALRNTANTEQSIVRQTDNVIRFARRQFADAKQTAEMLQASLLNFSGAVNPVTVQTMQLLLGDNSLQFDFVANSSSAAAIPHAETYDPETKQLSSAAGVIMHKTLGIDTVSSSHAVSEYKWWAMDAYISPVLDDATKSYYLYAKCSKTANTGIFLLSETAIALESVTGYYHLLVGILNSENDGDRSYSAMYGYTEITPGRITTKKIVSPSGNTYFDLENEIIAGKFNFKDGLISSMIALSSGETVTAGLQGDAAVNTAAWFGGTYAQAISNLAKIIFRKDGSGQLAGGKIFWDLLGALSVGNFKIEGGAIVGYSENSEKVKVHTGAIETLENLSLGVVYSQYIYGVNAPEENPIIGHEHNSSGIESIIQRFYEKYETLTVPAGSVVTYHEGTVSFAVTPTTNYTSKSTTQRMYIYKESTLIATLTNGQSTTLVDGGTYNVKCQLETNITLKATSQIDFFIVQSPYGYFTYPNVTGRTEIGNDGFSSFWSNILYLYFSKNGGLKYKGAIDIPAGLGGGTVVSAGTTSNNWGKFTPVSGKTGSTITITHNIGDSNYTILIMPRNSFTFYLSNKTNTTIQVVMSSSGGEFDYVLMRTV